MPFIIVSIIVQVLLVWHVMKTGRNTSWLYVILLLPLAGSIAYLVIEVLPEFTATRTGRNAKNKVTQALNPNRDMKRAVSDYSVTDTVENTWKLADECFNKGLFEEACGLYRKCLKGTDANNPDLMFHLARSEYGCEHYKEVEDILDELIKENPIYKNADAHLLYAKSLFKQKKIQQAQQELQVLDGYYPGAEATYLLAVLVDETEGEQQAKVLMQKIIDKSKVAGKHFNDLNRQWIKLAKKYVKK